MYELGRNFKRCEIRTVQFHKLAKKVNKSGSRPAKKCSKYIMNLRIQIENAKVDSFKDEVSCIVQLQQMLLVTAYNLLRGKEEVTREKLSHTESGSFELGKAACVVQHVADKLGLQKVSDALEPLLSTSMLNSREKGVLMSLQCQCIDHVLEAIDLSLQQKDSHDTPNT